MNQDERKYGDDVPVMAGDVVRESGCRATMTAVEAIEDGTGVVCRFMEPSHPAAVRMREDQPGDDEETVVSLTDEEVLLVAAGRLVLPGTGQERLVGTRCETFPIGSLILVRRDA